MRKKVNIFWVIALAFGVSYGGNWLYNAINNPSKQDGSVAVEDTHHSDIGHNVSNLAKLDENNSFVAASNKSTPAVVYIKTVSKTQVQSNPFDWFFNPYSSRSQVMTGTGSGVIISKDGYIVTNNHVINGAQTITVILNQRKREYKAELIGVDPSTDLGLLKIEANNLPSLTFGNSDDVSVGEWVLAVGNPFNLTSTVTAGIVSAKGRNINIVNNKFPIESFIQTDAAINPGNSGGALVNLEGQLVGINTAIASKTGSYSGYGFAIPANIANKIVKDLIEFGKVQRGFTGVSVQDIDYTLQKEKSISVDKGVYISGVLEDGPAESAGLEVGDIITAINGKAIDSKANYDEVISYYRPGDALVIKYVHNEQTKTANLKLQTEEANQKLIRKYTVHSEELGADFTPITKAEKTRYGINSGIRVSSVQRGYIARMGINDGFIITKYNGKDYNNAEDLIKAMLSKRGRIEIEGIGPNGGRRKMSFYGY